MKLFFSLSTTSIFPKQTQLILKMDNTQQMLLLKANEAIAALWMHQLKKISDATGVGMDILCNAIQGDFVPLQVNSAGVAPALPEKKKKGGKAPLEPAAAPVTEIGAAATTVPEKKKKGGKAPLEPAAAPVTEIAAAAAAVPEKKKKGGKAPLEPSAVPVTDNTDAAAVPEKKKGGKAPPKKKELVVVPDDASVAVSEVSAAVSNASSEKKAKNEAEALEKKAKKEAEALEKKIKKEMDAIEKKAKKDAEVLEKAAKKEAEALEKAAKKAEKKPPAKKAVKSAAAAKEEVKKPEVVAKFSVGEQVRYLRPTGKTVDAVVEYVIKYDDYVEYKLQVVGKNETILSREETTFTLDQIPNDPENESDDEDDADTVMMPETPAGSPVKGNKRLDVERVNINGTSYLISENNIAFLESSKKMVGKYDPSDQSIRQLNQTEQDEYYGVLKVGQWRRRSGIGGSYEYYGANSDGEASDEDECPDMSDMSGSESDSGSESE